MSMNNRTSIPSLRLSATLLLVGQLLYIVITQFHADGDGNNHAAVFAEYAGSGTWTAVHFGQFASMAILLTGGCSPCSSPLRCRVKRRDGWVDWVPLRQWRRWRSMASCRRWTASP